jgi:hypothetical protein
MPNTKHAEPRRYKPLSKVPVALGLAAGALAVVLLGGCGAAARIRRPPVRLHSAIATSRTAATTTAVPPMSSDAPTVNADVFARYETQTQPYFVSVQGRSRSEYCAQTHAGKTLAVVVERASEQEDGEPQRVSTATLGQSVEVCPDGFRGDLPLTLEWVSGGRVLRQSYPAGQLLADRTWGVLLDSRFTTGPQTISARQGTVTRTASLTLSPPRTRTLGSSARFEALTGEPASVLVAGVAPHTSVLVDLYAIPNEGGYNAVPQYRTTLKLKADARGLAEANFLTRASDHGQYALSLPPLHEGGEAQVILIDLDEVTQSFAGPVGLAPGEKPTGVFETHTAPPAGVAAQIAYFVGAGGSSCYSQLHATHPTIAFGRVVPRVVLVNSNPTPAAPQIGDMFFICAEHFPPGTPRMTITRPDGKREAAALQGQSPLTMYERSLLQGTEIGVYTVTAVQGAIKRTAHYRVSYPTEPGDVMLNERGVPPELLVVGLPPHQRYRVLVYETSAGNGGPHERARYNGSIERQADVHGVDTVPFFISPHDPHSCFVVRVQYGEHIVVDKEEGQTMLCLPLRSSG